MAVLTIDEALQQGIEAHKAGRILEAKRLYTAILKAQPKHPDANHYMGVMAVSVDRILEAIPFFKTALESNPNTAQFWLSYIDALIKLDKFADAKAVLDQARSKGAKGDGIDRLEQRLNKCSVQPPKADETAPAAHLGKPNILISRKQDQAIKLVKRKEGFREEVKNISQDFVVRFPGSKPAVGGLKRLSGGDAGKASKLQYDLEGELQSLIALYNEGQLPLVVERARFLTTQLPGAAVVWNLMGAAAAQISQLDLAIFAFQRFLAIKPNHAEVHNNLGNALKEQGKLEEAIDAYKKALAIKPSFADAYYNMGIPLQEQDKLDEAIQAYKKALAIKPDHPEACNNMGNAFQEQGNLEEAVQAYKKALALKPDNAEVYNNMGSALNDQGKLKGAMKAYKRALAIKPDYAEAVENSQILSVQLLPIIAEYGYDFDAIEAYLSSEFASRPKYQIYNAIKAYLEHDFIKAHSFNQNFMACDRKLLERLKPKDKVFCYAYSSFIGKLLDANWDEEHAPQRKVYHLGESHSLSYAHRNIIVDGLSFRIESRLTFGAKAFHLSRTKYDNFKAITKAHFVSAPRKSKFFLSFGEIDCRPKEGFISAAAKFDRPLEEIINQTTEGYVTWFADQNADQGHTLYFINVPAPVYDKEHDAELNSRVALTVALFNTALKKYSMQHGFDTVDVFKFTVGSEGFSNGLFHIDNHHLGVKALPEIQRQLAALSKN